MDGSKFAEAALAPATALARASHGDIELLTVQDPEWAYVNDLGWTFVDEHATEASRKAAERYMRDTRERLEPVAAKVSSAIREGFVADAIIEEADEFQADVLVMATHGRGPLTSLWLGSVASECARRAQRPTLLIRPTESGGPETFVRRLLVPVDGSDASERALSRAMELAILFRCPLTLMRVVGGPTVADTELLTDAAAETENVVEQAMAAASAYLEGLAATMRARGVQVNTRAIAAPDAASAIVAEASGDLIVMATHARRGVERAFMGSVTDAVVRSSTGSVMVIPPLAKTTVVRRRQADWSSPEPRARAS